MTYKRKSILAHGSREIRIHCGGQTRQKAAGAVSEAEAGETTLHPQLGGG